MLDLTVRARCSRTGRVRVPLEVVVEHFERLRREGSAPFALLGRFAADKLRQVLHPVLVPLLGLGHPPLQHRLDLLRALGRDVQLLKPTCTSTRPAHRSHSVPHRSLDKVSPWGRRDDTPPADGSSTVAYRFAANQAICVSPLTQKSRRIYVRPRTGPQFVHLWWPVVAKPQAASVPIA